jgi:hypothetical protein
MFQHVVINEPEAVGHINSVSLDEDPAAVPACCERR